jgi:hypothetical protein
VRLLREFHGVVEAAVDQVGPVVLVAPEAPGVTVVVDRAAGTLSVQGGWWYRGEHTVEDHPAGARIVYRIYNVSQVRRWMVPLVWRSFRRGMAAPDDQAARIGERLSAKAYVAG